MTRRPLFNTNIETDSRAPFYSVIIRSNLSIKEPAQVEIDTVIRFLLNRYNEKNKKEVH